MPLVLLIVMLAPLARTAGRTRRVLVLTCVAQCVIAAVAAYPFYLTYANAIGSFWPHYALFNDSNLDWDQSLPALGQFVNEPRRRLDRPRSFRLH